MSAHGRQKESLVIVAYFFPPVGGVGVRRTLGFVQRLAALGWELGVITPKDPAAEPKDPSGFALVPESVRVARTSAWEPTSYKIRTHLLAPDEWAGWVPFAVRSAMRWEFARDADVVYATAPPYSSLLAACAIARSLRKPLVVDFRDPWTINLTFRRTGARRWLEHWLERLVFKGAAAIIVNTDETLEAYAALYPEHASKLEVITNGFDGPALNPGPPSEAGPLRILHAGSLGGSRIEAAAAFLDGLAEAFRSLSPDDLNVRFLGMLGNEARELFASHPAARFVETPGFLPHDSVAQEMADADVLLLLANTEMSTALHIPAKLYEYMAIRRPVLAIAGQGGIRRVIEETGIGQCVSADDPPSIGAALTSLAVRKREGQLIWGGKPEAVAQYDRAILGSQLDTLLRRVIAEHRR